MVHTDKKDTLIIASGQFMCRFGIKTMLSVLGNEPDIIEMNDFNSIIHHLTRENPVNYLIMSDDILPEPKAESVKKLRKLDAEVKIMVIGVDLKKDNALPYQVLNADNQKEVLEELQDFFNASESAADSEMPDVLSDREIDVLRAVAQGYSNKEIAEKLFISANTVITHRKNITEKLGIKTIAGLTVYAIMKKIIEPDDVRM
ncbi:response regulator transcription factor [Saccharicrinis sp. FJH54]|uniref:helix-turn-helix transcriptional regulator n=1 Tax=Saccharicrinis sp. FJH54 TaxID=3344665 RepID=UPI0035D4ED82